MSKMRTKSAYSGPQINRAQSTFYQCP